MSENGEDELPPSEDHISSLDADMQRMVRTYGAEAVGAWVRGTLGSRAYVAFSKPERSRPEQLEKGRPVTYRKQPKNIAAPIAPEKKPVRGWLNPV